MTELVESASSGDTEAFELLYKFFLDEIYYHVGTCLERPEHTDDAVQQIVLHMCRSIKDLQSPYAFYAWMVRIIRNVCDKINRKNRGPKMEDIDEYADSIPDTDETAEDGMVEAELQLIVRQCLRKLPDKQRLALFLYYYKEMPYKEISSALGISEQTVGSNIMRAKRTLKKMVEDKTGSVAVDGVTEIAGTAAGPLIAGAFASAVAVAATPAKLAGISAAIDAGIAAGAGAAALNASTKLLQTLKQGVSFAGAVVVLMGGLYLGITLNKDAAPEPQVQTPAVVLAQWIPEADIAFSTEDAASDHQNPTFALLNLPEGTALSWCIVDVRGVSVVYGDGSSISQDVFGGLVQGDYKAQWTVENDQGQQALVSREFVIDR